jgi:hypothetical protein
MPVRWYHDRFTLTGRRLRIPVAHGRPPLWVRLDRDLPYPPELVRSVTLLYDAGRLWVDVTAEVPVACYPAGQEPDPARDWRIGHLITVLADKAEVAGIGLALVDPGRHRPAPASSL